MKKYRRIEKLTKEFLEGKLEKLSISYGENHTVEVIVGYEDPYNYRFDYDILYNLDNHDVKFLSHQGKADYFTSIPLERIKKFEHSVCSALFTSL